MASFRSPLAAFVVALSLVVQLIAMPHEQAAAGPALGVFETATIAANLKAIFGDAAGFCTHIDDKGSPSPQTPCHHCDQCPLCRIIGQAAAFVPPNAPTLLQRLDAGRHTIGVGPDFGGIPAHPARTNLARAPPLAV